MNYHNPDETWHIFQGVTDFSSFCVKYVAAGKFHPLVPDDVVKSYQVAEHVMAHSYYHYPMYDEALNKLLRTMEMAIKIRCKQVGISLEIQNPKKPKFPLDKHPLKTLLRKLNEVESGKYNMYEMESLVELRNILMHPEQHGFGGVAMTGILFKIVVVLNKIFLPLSFFDRSLKQVNEYNEKLAQFMSKPTVMIYQGTRFLVNEIKVVSSVPKADKNLYCLVVSPILNDAANLLTRHSYLPPWGFHIDNFLFEEGRMLAKINNSNEEVDFQLTDHPLNIDAQKKFLLAFDSCSQNDKSIYESFYNFKTHEESIKFLYENLWQVNV